MKRRKVCVVITARPSYARIKTALLAIKDHSNLKLQLVLAGSALLDRYGNASKIIENDGFKVNRKVFNILEGDTSISMAKSTGLAIIELSSVFESLKPDVVITIADRFETIATSIAASYQNIPLAHIQGGEVTGNIDEKVRHANTKLADIHLVATESARQRVIKLGEREETVIKTGCPSMDIAREVFENSNYKFDPILKYGGVGREIDLTDGYLVVLQHPVTTEFEKSKEQILITLQAIMELDIPTFWFWPNVDAGSDGTSKGIRYMRENNDLSKIHFFKNLEPEDFLRLLKKSNCLIGNSSAGIRESAFLGVPVVNIGSRQNERERAINVISVAHDKNEIKKAILKQLSNGHYESNLLYGDGYAGQKIANTLATCELNHNKTITY
tara:strand:- start:298 stop:1455 length:1158 start_codon:yes stop_codon:yes gene_type:complete